MLDSACESFQMAISGNNVRELELLLESGADPNGTFEKNGLLPLHLAAWYNRPQLIELLVDRGARVNQKEELAQKTPLHIAAYFGHLDCCRVLIEKKAIINEQDMSYFMPLHYAALRGHLKVVQLFSHNTKDLWESSICGTALDVAIRHKNLEIIDYLLTIFQEYSSFLHSKSKFFSFTHFLERATFPFPDSDALYFATLIGAKDIVELLLTKKQFAYEADINGLTPLHLAAEKGYSEIVKLLLNNLGYDAEEDMYFSSPLELALKNSHKSTIDVFVEKGTKLWLIDKSQFRGKRPTSTVAAAIWDGNYQKLKEILEHEGKGILFEKDTKREDPPLQLAVLHRQIEIAKLFIEYGGKELILQRDDSQMTALHRAAFHGALELYQHILHISGPELLNQPCETFGTPLDCALYSNHIEIVEWTLSQPQLDLSFEELFLNERDHWVLMDLNPKIGGYFTGIEGRLKTTL